MHSGSFGKFRGKVVNMKRFIMTTLVVLSAISAIFASTYIIDRYDFNFEGKTDVNEVYKFLGLSDGASFSSYEELQSHVIAKTQKLVNERIFTSVDYDIVEGDVVVTTPGDETANEYHYVAVYYVNDRSPFFIFPTPKYDSNYGAKIGLRIDSKNFGGKLAKFQINADMEQKDHSFSKADYGLDFGIVGFPIAGFDMDTTLSLGYDGTKEGLKGFTSGLSAKLYGIKVMGANLDTSVSFKYDGSREGIQSLTSDFTTKLTGVKVLDFNMDASAVVKYDGTKEKALGFSTELATKFYNIKLFKDITFSLSGGITLTPETVEMESFGASKYTYTAALGNLVPTWGGASLTHTLTYEPRSRKTSTDNSISYNGLYMNGKKINTSYSFKTEAVEGTPSVKLTMGPSFSVGIALPWSFTLTPSLSFSKVYATDGTWNAKDWTVSSNKVKVGASLSHSTINYVLDGNSDFRKGMYLSVSASREVPVMDVFNNPSDSATVYFTWFPFANSWFNPSIRVTGSLSPTPNKSLVSASDGKPTVSDYMRGIRDDNTYSTSTSDLKFVANIMLTTKCIDLGSWARTYAIAFSDIGLVRKTKDDEVKMLYTVGIEGIGIINDHPNYPVRASLGFNVDSLKTFSETNRFEDLEYELTFGLYYFY